MPALSRSLRRASVAAAAVLALGPASAATAAPRLSNDDPFYRHSGDLRRVPRGGVLGVRHLTLRLPAAVDGQQLLYRTTDQRGRPALAVTTILHPATPRRPTRLVAYQMAYDGLGPRCNPSFSLQGGSPTASSNPDEQQVVQLLLARGHTVVVSDYEGVRMDWLGTDGAGRATLDGIRAAQATLGLNPRSTPVGLVGYSGGALATGFAIEHAPTYAPQLRLAGAALGGIPVNLARGLGHLDGQRPAGMIVAVLAGLARGFRLDLRPQLSARGRRLLADVQGRCASEVGYRHPGLRAATLFRPRDRGPLAVRPLVRALNATILGRSGRPRIPLLLANGTADEMVPFRDVRALARRYCATGAATAYREYPGADHARGALGFLADAIPFLADRLDGRPATDDCGAIPRGGSLRPRKLPRAQRAGS